ncbi:hypothetical protein [Rhabdothermincola salaria]|uniref:hypothetical protein n=1 Tax=Rhabdothermincola salaria TaxID=2903142 RepID=UPI001E2C027F|nr:hypothetical protein [Rhabdothermincola salaria]MCD9622695.1 hypothetical protein [Rhabdothermincola salaria]
MPAVTSPATASRRQRILAAAAALLGLLALVVLVAVPARPAGAQEDGGRDGVDRSEVVVEVFWGDGCPHCEALLQFLDELTGRVDGVTVVAREVWYDRAAQQLMGERARAIGVRSDAVPLTIVGDQAWVGYSGPIGAQIEAAVLRQRGGAAPAPSGGDAVPDAGEATVIDVPLVGEVDVQGRSLLVATALIAVVDGLNPCSLWVLTMLLALVLHTGSRRRVAAIGGTFLFVTTLVYGLFIVGVYGAMSLVGSLGWIRALVAVFAICFGLVNVKDYLWFGAGPSLTIADERKPRLYRRARSLAGADLALPAALVAAAVMAAGVALVELPCTAGFPVVWSDLVANTGASGATFGVLLAVYLVVYLLDELVVFGAAVVTMRVTKLQERHGRALKLVGGMVMIVIGFTIVTAPQVLEEPVGSLVVFLVAAGLSALVVLVDRVVRRRLPARSESGR